MKILHSLPEEQWRQFVENQPWGNIFHTPEMFQVFERTKGYHPQLWAVVEDNGSQREVLVLLTLVGVTLLEGTLKRLTSRAIAYGSFVCDPAPERQQTLDILLETYGRSARRRVLFTELRHMLNPSAFSATLENNSYTYIEYLNYLIYLNRPIEEIWQAITKSGRKRIRKASKMGVEVTEIQDRDMLPIWYNLLRQTYIRAGIPLADISLFEAVFDILTPKGMAKFLLAKVEGHYAAASLEMPYKDIIYSWYAGFDWEYRKFSPNDVLVWHILKWGAENGYFYYDFGGAGQPNQDYGARDFKAKYSGELVSFGRHMCVHSPLMLAFSKLGYQAYRGLNRILPKRNK